MPNPLRARLRRALLAGTDAKLAGQQRQLDAQARQLEKLSRRTERLGGGAASAKSLERLRAAVTAVGTRLDQLGVTVRALDDRVAALETGVAHRDVDRERRNAQVGTLEERIARIDDALSYRERLESVVEHAEQAEGSGGKDSVGEAAVLLAEIRREHEQARVRMQIIASYEERLRRVEETVIKLHRGDERHQL